MPRAGGFRGISGANPRADTGHGDCDSPGQPMFNFRRFRVPPAGLPLLAVVFLASASAVLAQDPAPNPPVAATDPQAASPGPRPAHRLAAAGGNRPESDQSADDAVAQEPPQLLSTHPSVRARPSPRRALATSRRPLQPRRRRGHRPGVPLRHHRKPAGGRQPLDAGQDDPDIRPVGRAAPGRRAAAVGFGHGVVRRPEQSARRSISRASR